MLRYMSELYTPQPGDIGLVHTNGPVGKLIRLGQWLNGDGFEDFEHAFVVTDEWSGNGKQMIVQAEPGGAQFVELPVYSPPVHWCLGISHKLTPAQRTAVSQAAIDFIGTGYSFLDYFSLVALRLNIPAPGLEDFVKSTKHVICSQLAAASYDKAGVPIWPGQWTGNDTPGDLYQMDMKLRAAYADPRRPPTA
jgi:hypothetical protein